MKMTKVYAIVFDTDKGKDHKHEFFAADDESAIEISKQFNIIPNKIIQVDMHGNEVKTVWTNKNPEINHMNW